MITEDICAWQKYPEYRSWFNKLWISNKLGYKCGPAGVPVPEKGLYAIRPIYNLRGMGVGAYIEELSPEKTDTIPAGYFWCEKFEGDQYTFDLNWKGYWRQKSCWKGFKESDELWRFTSWEKKYNCVWIPHCFDVLGRGGVHWINVETIEGHIIEVHLRGSPDPYGKYTILIPRWEDTDPTLYEDYDYIESYDDADGQLPKARLGFYAK